MSPMLERSCGQTVVALFVIAVLSHGPAWAQTQGGLAFNEGVSRSAWENATWERRLKKFGYFRNRVGRGWC
jgi:hypothetical protein